MIIEVRLVDSPVRRWHLELIDRLASLPHVQVTLAERPKVQDSRNYGGAVEGVMAFERLLHRAPPGLGTPQDSSVLDALPLTGERTADIELDLSSTPRANARTWWVEFDGHTGERAAFEALRRGAQPLVHVVRPGPMVAASGRPGSEMPGVLATAFDDMLAGCITLIIKAVLGEEATTPSEVPLGQTSVPSLSRHLVKQAVGSVAHRGYRALYRAPHWRVGWRYVDGPGLIDQPDSAPGGWHDLPDDGLRFYADPVPFIHLDRTYLFVEDYEHRLGRGVVSMVEFDAAGPMHTPVPVLEHRVHLSYPFVLEAEGDVWMIPETSAAGTVELYRAAPFPHDWTLVTTIVDGVEASDATLFRRNGKWWMLATVRSQGSFSDALSIWFADRLRGPWSAHPHNPVLIDIASARPAGRVEERDGRLLRPVQDCRNGYGAALAVAEILRLDEQHFDQRVIARISPGAAWWPGRRLHTLNRAGRLECIDGSAMAPRLWRPRTKAPDEVQRL